jgi:hypothetical protein
MENHDHYQRAMCTDLLSKPSKLQLSKVELDNITTYMRDSHYTPLLLQDREALSLGTLHMNHRGHS